MTTQQRIAAVLRQLRIEHEISIEQASKDTGEDIEIIEAGVVDLRIGELEKLVDYFGVADIGTFFELAENFEINYGSEEPDEV